VTGRYRRDPFVSHIARWISVQGQALKPDRGMAEAFLMRLDSLAERFSFRTFSDTSYTREGGDDPLETAIHGTLDACWHELVRLNSAGAAIAVTINQTNGHGRTPSDIVRVRALFLDDDRGGDPDRFPLRPHLQVQTSWHHCHYYWFVDGMRLGDFSQWQRQLAAHYQGDPRVFALNQSMQLPGLWRRKRVIRPSLPRPILLSDARNYPVEDLFSHCLITHHDHPC
jgi:hypothetical protein